MTTIIDIPRRCFQLMLREITPLLRMSVQSSAPAMLSRPRSPQVLLPVESCLLKCFLHHLTWMKLTTTIVICSVYGSIVIYRVKVVFIYCYSYCYICIYTHIHHYRIIYADHIHISHIICTSYILIHIHTYLIQHAHY